MCCIRNHILILAYSILLNILMAEMCSVLFRIQQSSVTSSLGRLHFIFTWDIFYWGEIYSQTLFLELHQNALNWSEFSG